MLCANDKLITVARMLKVVYKARCDNCQLIMLLEILLYVANFHHEVKPLKGINNMLVIVVGIFFKVSLGNLTNKTHKIFEFYACKKEQLVLL